MESRTDLHSAILKNDFKQVEQLLNNGADITLVNQEGYTPIALAAKLNAWQCVDLIAQKRNNVLDGNYIGHQEALFKALSAWRPETILFLLKAGTPITDYKVDSSFISRMNLAKDNLNYTPLHFAICNRSPSVIRDLLTYGADAFGGQHPIVNFALKLSNTELRSDLDDSDSEDSLEVGYFECYMEIQNFKSQLTGERIYKKLMSSALTPEQIEQYANYKEAVLAVILKIPNKQNRMTVLNLAKDPDTQLGHFFWLKRGFNRPTLETGVLKRIVDQIEVEQRVKLQPPVMHTTTYLMTAMPTYYNPNFVMPSVPQQEQQLVPVYQPTLKIPLAPLYKGENYVASIVKK